MASYKTDLDNKFMYTVDENGEYHSFFGMPAIEYMESNIYIWYSHGIMHRPKEEGPAYLSDNMAKYFTHGKLDNINGKPAVIKRYSNYFQTEFWTNGIYEYNTTKRLNYSGNFDLTLNKLTSIYSYNTKYTDDKIVGTYVHLGYQATINTNENISYNIDELIHQKSVWLLPDRVYVTGGRLA